MLNTDPLTQAHTRAALDERLRAELAQVSQSGGVCALIVFDLDHFKSINDAFGHARGDAVLAELAQRIRHGIRTDDLLVRLGGDEFVLLLPGMDRRHALAFARRVGDLIADTPFAGDPPLTLSLSLGVAEAPSDAITPERLFERADQRLYAAKRLGRSQAVGDDQATTQPNIPEPTALIERDACLQEALELVATHAGQAGQALCISGLPGSGRSRLLRELAQATRRRGTLALEVQATPALQASPFACLRQAVAAAWPAQPAAASAEPLAQQIWQALCAPAPAVICIDDLPHLDLPSLAVLRALLFSPQRAPLLIATTDQMRTEALPCQHHMQLAPLTPAGLRAWLQTTLPGDPPDALADWLHRQTGGLPARVQRLIALLIRRQQITAADGVWRYPADLDMLGRDLLNHEPPAPPHNLPSPSTPLIGRTSDIDQIITRLGSERLVTLAGPGGIGKTRLAIQVAHTMRSFFPHGVFAVFLAALNDPQFLVSTISQTLGVSNEQSQQPLRDALAEHLREQRLLLVLDNFEHLQSQAELLAELLRRAPELKMLVTSRERLGLPGEVLVEVRGLDVPGPESLEQAERYTAVQLFLWSAWQALPSYTLSPDNRRAVAHICKLLEGMPLGIEMAAALVRQLASTEIAERIQQDLDSLTSPQGDANERHGSLRALFNYSWRVLGAEQQRGLRKLTVFRGGFSRAAAERVATVTLDHLVALFDKSLVYRHAAGRYELHEQLRQYAEEQLEAQPLEAQSTRQEHAAYYLELAEQAELLMSGAEQPSALARVDQDYANLQVALGWMCRERRWDWGLRMIAALWHYWRMRGYISEGWTWASAVLPHSRDQRTLARAKALYGAGWLAFDREDLASERALWEESLQVARELGDRSMIGMALQGVGEVLHAEDHYDEAIRCFHESLAIFYQLDNIEEAAWALDHLGRVACAIDQYQAASAYFAESLALFERIQHPWGLSLALFNCGYCAQMLGALEQAERYFDRSIVIYQKLGHQRSVGRLLNELGCVAWLRGNRQRAAQCFAESLAICREQTYRWGSANVLYNHGCLALVAAQPQTAAAYFRESLVNFHHMRLAVLGPAIALCIQGLAEAARQEGTLERAARLYAAAQRIIETSGHRRHRECIAYDYQAGLALLRAQLGEQALAAIWVPGGQLTLEEAIAEALGYSVPP